LTLAYDKSAAAGDAVRGERAKRERGGKI